MDKRHSQGDEASRIHSRGIAFALLSAGAFGSLAPIAKLTYEAGARPLSLLAVRFLVAAGILALAHQVTGRSLAVGRSAITKLLLLGGLAYGFEASLFFAALEIAPASIVSLVFFSFPLFTAIFALAFRLEPFRRRTFLALALGGAGVASIFEVSRSEPAGPLLALGAAVVVAVYFILAGIFLRGIPSGVGATWTATGAGVALLLASLVTKQGMPAEAWWGAVALGVLTAVAFTTLYAAMQRLGSARTAVAQMFEPVVTVVLAAMFLGEQITWRVALGAALIVSSLPILAGTARRKKDVPPAADSL